MSDPTKPYDKKEHKKAVNKMRAIKKQRRMKMRGRDDDMVLEPGASVSIESFCVDTMPEEANQENWLNELIEDIPNESTRAGSLDQADCALNLRVILIAVVFYLAVNFFLKRG